MIKVKLAEFVEIRGITLYQLIKDTGLTAATIYGLANKKKKGIDFKTLDLLCEKLNCQPNDLMIYEKKD